MFVSKHTTFLKKDYVFKRRSERKIELDEVQKPQTYIQIKLEHETITLDV